MQAVSFLLGAEDTEPSDSPRGTYVLMGVMVNKQVTKYLCDITGSDAGVSGYRNGLGKRWKL